MTFNAEYTTNNSNWKYESTREHADEKRSRYQFGALSSTSQFLKHDEISEILFKMMK